MDTVTHTLFGLTLYAAVDKKDFTPNQKKALLLTTVVGSNIPDIDVISAWWDTAGRYQMWHRGITHSIFLVPVWAAIMSLFNWLVFKVKGWKLLAMGLLAVFIHNTSDLFNAWGTGYVEPFATTRVTFGTIPIVDFTFWAIMLGGLLFSKIKKPTNQPRVYKIVWALMISHLIIQSVQGYALHQKYADQYDEFALAAGFVPGQFQMIGKKGDTVTISNANVFTEPKLTVQLKSKESSNLDRLFMENPKAKTLHEWSPFVVIVDNDKEIGIYDPRFYRNGESFLYESISK
ncbi:metal-dependent hydrolase [Paenibacillus sp. 481]|uniref:metal-dependent hydrolase n=1 Tax=Paenibacillus sp. 481 TaxID=2835869 RepID=UPI001E37160E|nr:metal-dependent hydrolase [Paenibacillus sp. 481]UHA71900.1 metal-dependent hydrolase [Paenibacillus sp. 481]